MSSGTSWWIFNARNRFCLEDSSGSKLLLPPRKWEAGDEGRWAAGRPIPAPPALRDPTGGRSLGGAGKVAQAFGRDGATVVSSWPAVGLVTVVDHIVEDFETAVKLKLLSWWLAGGWRWWPPPPTSRQGRRPWVTRRRRGAWWTWWTRPWPARATRCPGSKWWGSPPPSQHDRFSCLHCRLYSALGKIWPGHKNNRQICAVFIPQLTDGLRRSWKKNIQESNKNESQLLSNVKLTLQVHKKHLNIVSFLLKIKLGWKSWQNTQYFGILRISPHWRLYQHGQLHVL